MDGKMYSVGNRWKRLVSVSSRASLAWHAFEWHGLHQTKIWKPQTSWRPPRISKHTAVCSFIYAKKNFIRKTHCAITWGKFSKYGWCSQSWYSFQKYEIRMKIKVHEQPGIFFNLSLKCAKALQGSAVDFSGLEVWCFIFPKKVFELWHLDQ